MKPTAFDITWLLVSTTTAISLGLGLWGWPLAVAFGCIAIGIWPGTIKRWNEKGEKC